VDARLAATAASLSAAVPKAERQTFIARPLSRLSISPSPQNDDELRGPSLLLLFLAGIVLLVASLNVASMMLVRGHARRREIAIRLALGARRRSILGQLFAEGLLLALAGGAAGLLVAAWSTTVLTRSLASLAPVDLVVSPLPDVRVLVATASFCLLSTVLFAVGPAWNLSRPNVAAEIKNGVPDAARGGWRRRLLARRNLPVIGQLGLSLMLLSTAGLFIRSSLRAAALEPGFRLDESVIVEVDPALAGYDPARGKVVLRALVEHFRALPGVRSASLAATVPFGMVSLGRDLQRASDPAGAAGAKPAEAVSARYNIVAEDYFATLGIPLLRGREFASGERGGEAPAVAILDRLAAERLWPHGDALGRSVRLRSRDEERTPAQAVEVVGIVDNVRESLLGEGLQPHVYLPFGPVYQSDMNLHVRLGGGGAAAEARLLAAARREVAAVDGQVSVLAARSLRQHLDGAFDVWVMRIAARMFTLFGLVAVLLAGVGLYGVRAFAVARRTREIGIRMAIGANASDALRLVLREGVSLAAIGLVGGLLLSLALGRVLAGMLYRVGGADPLVLLVAAASLAAVSLLACYVPARRAARIAPMVSLRTE
jgi:predicted permease